MAQTNGNTPEDLRPGTFRALASQYGEWAKTCRFVVRILNSGTNPLLQAYGTFLRDLSYLCESTDLPSRGYMNADVRYYGPSFKLPFQSSYEDIVLTLLCRTESYERQFFDDWQNLINPTNSWDFNYRDDYKAEIQLFQLAEYPDTNTAPGQSPGEGGGSNRPSPSKTTPKAVYQFTLHNAWPVLVNSQPVSWADDNVQRLAVAFTYTHWTTPRNLESKDRSGFGGLVTGRNETGY